MQTVVLAIEQAAQQSGMPISEIWLNVSRLGNQRLKQALSDSIDQDVERRYSQVAKKSQPMSGTYPHGPRGAGAGMQAL